MSDNPEPDGAGPVNIPEPPKERFYATQELQQATGGAPEPWWWPERQPDPEPGASRPPSAAHSEFAAAALDPRSSKHRDAYVHWLYAKSLGYQGFSVPIGAWLRGPLRDWAEALLDERRLREQGLLDPAPVRALWAAHQAGRVEGQYPLWTVLMLQAWQEAWG